MGKSKMNSFSKEEFKLIVLNSTSLSDCLRNLGYQSISGDVVRKLKDKIKEENIEISHFELSTSPVKRTVENIFIIDSTAC